MRSTEYSRPLLATVAGLAPEEKVVLVGHSFGGVSLALAMEQYPDRVAVAVFVATGMPSAGPGSRWRSSSSSFCKKSTQRTATWTANSKPAATPSVP